MALILRLLAIGVMLLVILATFYQASSTTGLNWFGEKFPGGAYIATTILLFLGIAFSSIYRNLSASTGDVDILVELKKDI
jgi:hypothetical protein